MHVRSLGLIEHATIMVSRGRKKGRNHASALGIVFPKWIAKLWDVFYSSWG